MTDALANAVLDRRPLAGIAVIDAHAHLGSYSRFFIPDPDAASMVRVMDRCGVDTATISAHRAFAEDAAAGNDETAHAVDAHPGRLQGYIVANPHQDPARELARWDGNPAMVGVKLHPGVHNYELDGPAYEPVWEFAARTGCPVLTHTWAGSKHNGLPNIEAVLRAHPEVKLVAGHALAMRDSYSKMIDLAQRYPNVYPEICGSYCTRHWVQRLVREIGADRVLYGSDFPFFDMRFSIARVVLSDLSEEEKAQVLGGFARLTAGSR